MHMGKGTFDKVLRGAGRAQAGYLRLAAASVHPCLNCSDKRLCLLCPVYSGTVVELAALLWGMRLTLTSV